MEKINREYIQRAIGIIEGVSFGVKSNIQDALAVAINLLESILDDEARAEAPKKGGAE